MTIDWAKYKQIVLNDRPVAYRIEKDTLYKLRKMYKDINVFGFGKYSTGFWYILACSENFPENSLGTPVLVSMSEVVKWSGSFLTIVK